MQLAGEHQGCSAAAGPGIMQWPVHLCLLLCELAAAERQNQSARPFAKSRTGDAHLLQGLAVGLGLRLEALRLCHRLVGLIGRCLQ